MCVATLSLRMGFAKTMMMMRVRPSDAKLVPILTELLVPLSLYAIDCCDEFKRFGRKPFGYFSRSMLAP